MDTLVKLHGLLCDAHSEAVSYASDGKTSGEIIWRRSFADDIRRVAQDVYDRIPAKSPGYFWLGAEADNG